MSEGPPPGHFSVAQTVENTLSEQLNHVPQLISPLVRSSEAEQDGQIWAWGSQAEGVSGVGNKSGSIEIPLSKAQDDNGCDPAGDLEARKTMIREKRDYQSIKNDAGKVGAGGNGAQNQSTRKKTSAQRKNKTGSVESLFRRPGQTKSGEFQVVALV